MRKNRRAAEESLVSFIDSSSNFVTAEADYLFGDRVCN
jgi:hypothetical protein